jgi:hypothetical protein
VRPFPVGPRFGASGPDPAFSIGFAAHVHLIDRTVTVRLVCGFASIADGAAPSETLPRVPFAAQVAGFTSHAW